MTNSSESGLWDPESDPERLASVMRRSGYSADQFARLMAEVAAAEAREAERRGLPGLAKIRDTVSRQTVERWAKGTSPPKGLWARLALIVIERLEQTLESGFDVGAVPEDDGPAGMAGGDGTGLRPRARKPTLRVLSPIALVTLLALVAVTLSGDSAGSRLSDRLAPEEPSVLPDAGPSSLAPPVANDDPTEPSGAGCDPSPAVAWWAAPESEPLPDGAWFGRVLEIEPAEGGGHETIFDIACYYEDRRGGDISVRPVPVSPSLQNEGAVLLVIPEGAPIHWAGEGGAVHETSATEWLEASSHPTGGGRFPVVCPSGMCSAWADVRNGVVTEMVVVVLGSD